MSLASGRWINEPQVWSASVDQLLVRTDAETDFWRETHYGFTHDNGHVWAHETCGDFTAEVRVQARLEALYDQAGLMVRIDEANWVKAGMEWSDGRILLGSVLTVERSDWATGVYAGDPEDFRIRATVQAGVIRLQVSGDGLTWPLLRLAPFPNAAAYLVGPLCCTPTRAGLEVRFSEFTVGPPSGKDIHDLS